MDYQSLHAQTVVDLRKLAKERGVRVPAGTNKQRLVELLVEADGRAQAEAKPAPAEVKPAPAEVKPAPVETKPAPAEAKPEPAKRGAGRSRKAAPAAQAGKAPEEKASERIDRRAKTGGAARSGKKAEKAAPEASNAAARPDPAEAKPARTAAKQTPDPAEAKPVRAAAKQAPDPAEAKPARTAAKQAPDPAEAKPVRAAAKQAPAPSKPETSAQARVRGFAGRRENGANRGDVASKAAQAGDRARRDGFVQRAANAAGQDRAPVLRRAPEGSGRLRRDLAGQKPRVPEAPQPPQAAPVPTSAQVPEASAETENRVRREGVSAVEPKPVAPEAPPTEGGEGAGVLELQPDGYGFLRAENCLPGPNDVYLSIAQIRRFNLRMGDYVEGRTRPQREGDRYSAIMYITRVNGAPPEEVAARRRFEDLVPVYPDQRLRLERPGGSLSLRLVDMLAPIGKGQRGMIVSPPKAGKTTLLKQIANSITAGYPDVHLIVLLIDERPEEVTDMKRSIQGEVVYSTFDEMPENHTRVAEMVLARAQRLVEMGKDVVVLMDSITRLARAYNLVIAPTGRSLSGGLDPGALFKPKRFFGAARNIENGGSLTIVATALVDTGSRMDDIIYEEFKGTGNMELHLDRKLSDRRVFPAIDMVRSGTRREELLLTEEEQAGEMQVRRMLGNGKDPEMPEQIINLMTHTHSNEDFFQRLKGWVAVAEKEGFGTRLR